MKFCAPRVVLVLALLSLTTGQAAPRRVYLRIITAPDAAGIEQVAEQLEQGQSFAAVARRFSTHPTAAQGGYLGELEVAALQDTVRKVVLGLRAGETSAPFRSGAEWAVIHRPPGDFRLRAHRLQERAQQWMEEGELDRAVALCRESLEIFPESAHAYFLLGVAYGRKKDPDREIDSFGQAIRLQERYHQAHYNLGLALLKRGDARGAARALERSVEIKPDLTGSWISLSSTYLKLGDPYRAAQAARKAIESNPLRASGYYNLGVALMPRDPRQALSHFETAAVLAPERMDFRMSVAVALAELGQFARARRVARTIIEKQPDFEPARALLARLP